jgi:hypothetical protein
VGFAIPMCDGLHAAGFVIDADSLPEMGMKNTVAGVGHKSGSIGRGAWSDQEVGAGDCGCGKHQQEQDLGGCGSGHRQSSGYWSEDHRNGLVSRRLDFFWFSVLILVPLLFIMVIHLLPDREPSL